MPETSCPNCQTLRAPNAVFCHVCGFAFALGKARDVGHLGAAVRVTEHRMSFGTAVTIGAGLTVGALLIGIVGAVLSGVVFAGLLAGLFRALPGSGG